MVFYLLGCEPILARLAGKAAEQYQSGLQAVGRSGYNPIFYLQPRHPRKLALVVDESNLYDPPLTV